MGLWPHPAARISQLASGLVESDRVVRRVTVPSHVLARSVGDDTVLLDLHQDEYFALDHVGTRAWSLITAGAEFDAIVDDIAQSYAVDRARVERDVEALLGSLVASGLLVEV